MDPLRLDQLAALENWDTFTPDMKGYIPPKEVDLRESFTTIESRTVQDQLREYIDPTHMRDNDAPIMASSVSKGFPVARLKIGNETFSVPLSRRETTFLAHDLGNFHDRWGSMSIDVPKIMNDDALKAISFVILYALRNLRADNSLESNLQRLVVFREGCHQLSTTAETNSHKVTVFVFLPTLTDSGRVRVRATHESRVIDLDLSTDLSGDASAVAIYTGVEHAFLEIGLGDEVACLTYHQCVSNGGDYDIAPCLENLAGALPPLRDGFCLWRHKLIHNQDEPTVRLFLLDCHPKHIRDFLGDDATLLCHLAPLAKAYGFKLFISQLIYTESTTEEVYHEYEEWEGDLDTSNLEMSSRPQKTYEWVGLRDLGGQEVKQPDLLRLAETMVKRKKGYYYGFVEDLDHESNYEATDESKYYTTVNYTHVRKATVLFVVA